MSRTESSMPPTGFSVLLKSLREDPKNFSESAYSSLLRLLTYDNRWPIEDCVEALNEWECELLKALETRDRLKLSPVPESAPDGQILRVFYNNFGRLHVRSETMALPNYGPDIKLETIGYLSIPQDVLEIVQKNTQSVLAEEAELRAEIEAFLEERDSSGQLSEIVETIDDLVRHIDNVYIYIDDELLSLVMDGYTNLIDTHKTTGIFSHLKEKKSLKEWSPAERFGIGGLWCLFLSGRAGRFEEFNGKMMTALRISKVLHRLQENYLQYGAKFDAEVEPNSRMGLFEIAKRIGQIAQQSVGQNWLRYRLINGLTWFKTERVTYVPNVAEVDGAIPDRLAELYESWVEKPFSPNLGYEKIFAELADVAIANPGVVRAEILQNSPAKIPIEVLIQEIVTAASVATDSDYAMSSSLRNPSLFLEEDDRLCLAAMLALKPKDFYCCVMSRSGLRQQIGSVISDQLYRPVQARMEYNRWHFIPANFPKADIPRTRHYFNPPAMPDLAEWSDQHHPGHILASVRYSIRSPGPDLNQPPLLIAGRPYRGFYDIRVVRMDGVPYNLQEMLVARHHTLWMGVVWKRIIAHCENNPGSVKIVGFEKGDGYEPLPKTISLTVQTA